MTVSTTVETIKKRIQVDEIDIALVLGSGLSGFADQIDGVAIDYSDLPAFPMPASRAIRQSWSLARSVLHALPCWEAAFTTTNKVRRTPCANPWRSLLRWEPGRFF